MAKLRVSRRRLLGGITGAGIASAIGCGSSGEEEATGAASSSSTGGDGGQGGIGGAGGSGGGAVTSGGGHGGQGGQGAGGSRPDACGPMGKDPKALLAPIENIVVLCMENRSFDHYLGSLDFIEKRDVDGLKGTEWNPDPNGVPVPVFKLNNFTVSNPPHSWDDIHGAWDNGKNDGFVLVHAGIHQQDVMGYHVRDQIPQTYALADAFTVCDRYFCSLLGPTWPNRFYLHAASSNGHTSNTPTVGLNSIWDLLDAAQISNLNYWSDIPWCSTAYGKLGGLSGIDNFFNDALTGNLPQFSIIDPTFFGAGANDDHPNHDVKLGQAFIGSIFAAIAASPQYNKTLFVITYDENGGFFDHVPPPSTFDDDPNFAQLGFRVPTIVCGPYVRKGCSVSKAFEHVSIIKTAMTKWGLPALNQRAANAADLTACINPDYLNDPQKPPVLPPVPVSMKKLRAQAAASRSAHLAQPEMWAIAESGAIPRHLDRRRQSLEIAERWIRVGAELGAIKLID